MEHNKEYKKGISAALFTAILWGFLPIYWKTLDSIDSWVIILYRIVLVGLCCFLAAYKFYGLKTIKETFKTKGVALRYFFSGLLITANWSIFIWAVNAGHVIETSIGYYMEPLVVSLFGVFIFKERLNKFKKGAMALALLAVIIMVIHFGGLPWIALSLATTFAIYAAVKKQFVMPPALSLLFETAFLVPFALIAIIYLEANGLGSFSMLEFQGQYILLLCCGIVTAVPLGLFAFAANRINLITLGITEYIAPSISLLLGIFLFKEDFDKIQFMACCLIWIGLVFFTIGELKDAKSK